MKCFKGVLKCLKRSRNVKLFPSEIFHHATQTCAACEQVLEDNMDLLSTNLHPKRHYAFLRSAAVLNSDDQETIDNPRLTRQQSAIALVDVLRTKGPRAFDALCRSLEQDKTQLFLLSRLNKSLEREIGRPSVVTHMHAVFSSYCSSVAGTKTQSWTWVHFSRPNP